MIYKQLVDPKIRAKYDANQSNANMLGDNLNADQSHSDIYQNNSDSDEDYMAIFEQGRIRDIDEYISQRKEEQDDVSDTKSRSSSKTTYAFGKNR